MWTSLYLWIYCNESAVGDWFCSWLHPAYSKTVDAERAGNINFLHILFKISRWTRTLKNGDTFCGDKLCRSQVSLGSLSGTSYDFFWRSFGDKFCRDKLCRSQVFIYVLALPTYKDKLLRKVKEGTRRGRERLALVWKVRQRVSLKRSEINIHQEFWKLRKR